MCFNVLEFPFPGVTESTTDYTFTPCMESFRSHDRKVERTNWSEPSKARRDTDTRPQGTETHFNKEI